MAETVIDHKKGKFIRKHVESVRLRSFYQYGETPEDDIAAFLQAVEWASRADISGATYHSWANVDAVLKTLLLKGDIELREEEPMWVYRWKD